MRAAIVFAGLAVVLGAFGAHALEERLDERGKELWETATFYQFVHALGGLFIARWLHEGRGFARATAIAFLIGTVIFAGTLYGMALGGPRWLGAITPIGGSAYIAGWVFAFIAAGRSPK